MRFSQRRWRALLAAAVVLSAVTLAPPGPRCRAAEKPDADARLKALLKERVANAKDIYDWTLERYNRGSGTLEAVHRAKIGLLNARLGTAATKGERVKLYEELVKETKDWEQSAYTMVERGAGQRVEALRARAERIEAEISLEYAKAEPELVPPPKK